MFMKKVFYAQFCGQVQCEDFLISMISLQYVKNGSGQRNIFCLTPIKFNWNIPLEKLSYYRANFLKVHSEGL